MVWAPRSNAAASWRAHPPADGAAGSAACAYFSAAHLPADVDLLLEALDEAARETGLSGHSRSAGGETDIGR